MMKIKKIIKIDATILKTLDNEASFSLLSYIWTFANSTEVNGSTSNANTKSKRYHIPIGSAILIVQWVIAVNNKVTSITIYKRSHIRNKNIVPSNQKELIHHQSDCFWVKADQKYTTIPTQVFQNNIIYIMQEKILLNDIIWNHFVTCCKRLKIPFKNIKIVYFIY